MMKVNIGNEANVPASLRVNDSAYQSKSRVYPINDSLLTTDQQTGIRLPNMIFNEQPARGPYTKASPSTKLNDSSQSKKKNIFQYNNQSKASVSTHNRGFAQYEEDKEDEESELIQQQERAFQMSEGSKRRAAVIASAQNFKDKDLDSDMAYAANGGVSGLRLNSDEQMIQVSRSQLKNVMKSKLDMYNILTKEG